MHIWARCKTFWQTAPLISEGPAHRGRLLWHGNSDEKRSPFTMHSPGINLYFYPIPQGQMLPKSDSEKSVYPITHSPQFSGLPWKLLFEMTSPTRPAHCPALHWRCGSSRGRPGHWSSTAWGLHSQNRGDPDTSLPAASSCPKARTEK